MTKLQNWLKSLKGNKRTLVKIFILLTLPGAIPVALIAFCAYMAWEIPETILKQASGEGEKKNE